MPHNFKDFPELTNNQMQIYYFQSPHKQITEDFRATVMKVIDGDTIRVSCGFRDFSFPVRLFNLAAPEIKERRGRESQSWLEHQILGKEVDIIISKSRVEKWGRLLADVRHKGFSMSEESIRRGHGVAWADREQAIPSFFAELEAIKI